MMNHLPTGLAFLTLMGGALLLSAIPGAGADTAATSSVASVQFGMDAASMAAQKNAGVKADYGTFWIGPWTLSSGWGGPDAQLVEMKNANVTPAIHFYYWGDDITPTCVENGCWSSLHNAQKTRTGWEALGTQMTDHLTAKMGGKPVVVFLESEFNKGGISSYEPFDGYMAAMADKIHAAYPNAIIVLGFGNWDSTKWANFDRAAAASDMVGLQGMRGSTKDTSAWYDQLYDATLTGVKTLNTQFPGKPVMLTDIALSSYPEPAYTQKQADNLAKFFTGLPALKEAGVTAIIYRSWQDSPNMALANYYGQAERYWGLANSASAKPSAQVWIDGVTAERAAATTPEPPAPPAAPVNRAPTASMTASAVGLTASVDATGASDPDGDALSYAWTFGDGSSGAGVTVSHAYAAAGTYTVGLTVSDGALSSTSSQVVNAVQPNRAPSASITSSTKQLTVTADASGSSDADGDALTYAWTFGDGTSATGRTTSHAYATAGAYTLTLTVSDGKASTTASAAVTALKPYSANFTTNPASNEWWMQEKVVSSPAPAKVDVQVNGGAWQPMKLQSYGDWTLATHVVKGTQVVFRATAADGQTSVSTAQPWLGAAVPPAPSAPAPAPAFTATFTPKAVGNDWWLETGVSSSQAIAKVEAKLNGGTWVQLPKDSWGTYAKSLNAPNGTQVVFRATSTTGAVATSSVVTWT